MQLLLIWKPLRCIWHELTYKILKVRAVCAVCFLHKLRQGNFKRLASTSQNTILNRSDIFWLRRSNIRAYAHGILLYGFVFDNTISG